MKFVKLLAIAAISILIAGCSDQKPENTIIVGTSADNPPYEFIKDGEIVGLDIDIINEIGKKLRKKVIIKNLDFHGLLGALASKNIDAVIAGLSITQERMARVDFSVPYTSAQVSVLYRLKDNFKGKEDLMGKVLGAQLGTIWGQVAQILSNDYKNKIQTLANNLMLVQELKAGVVDAVILEEAQTKQFIANNPELASFLLPEVSSEFAIAFPKNSELKDKVDKAIETLKIHGTIESIEKKWFQ
jgi:polar amino acid transport system substrate-binding protein